MKKRIRSAAFFIMVIGLFVVFGLFRASTSQAVVKVLPRLNISGDILKDESGVDIPLEDFVLLGNLCMAQGITLRLLLLM